MIEIDQCEGTTDIEKLQNTLSKEIAAVIIQKSKFFGIIEEVGEIEKN